MKEKELPSGKNKFDIFYQFAKERDEAFIRFMNDEQLFHVVMFANKWGIDYPKSDRIFKIAICRAIQHCPDIEIKYRLQAIEMAQSLGYKGDDIKIKRKRSEKYEDS